jgi:hypothetical protein
MVLNWTAGLKKQVFRSETYLAWDSARKSHYRRLFLLAVADLPPTQLLLQRRPGQGNALDVEAARLNANRLRRREIGAQGRRVGILKVGEVHGKQDVIAGSDVLIEAAVALGLEGTILVRIDGAGGRCSSGMQPGVPGSSPVNILEIRCSQWCNHFCEYGTSPQL